MAGPSLLFAVDFGSWRSLVFVRFWNSGRALFTDNCTALLLCFSGFPDRDAADR